jgi:hypothetical protein
MSKTYEYHMTNFQAALLTVMCLIVAGAMAYLGLSDARWYGRFGMRYYGQEADYAYLFFFILFFGMGFIGLLNWRDNFSRPTKCIEISDASLFIPWVYVFPKTTILFSDITKVVKQKDAVVIFCGNKNKTIKRDYFKNDIDFVELAETLQKIPPGIR